MGLPITYRGPSYLYDTITIKIMHHMFFDRILQAVLNFLYKDITSMRIVLSWLALTLGYGFYQSSSTDGNYHYLSALMPYPMWAVLYIVYGISMHVVSFEVSTCWVCGCGRIFLLAL